MKMKPERENNLVDLLDRLLNKGIILNADLILSVAGVPLIGINLRAALASIETMLDNGIMEAWDESTREWYKNELTSTIKSIPLTEKETILQRTFGYIWYIQGIIQAWRPGFWYLTNKRLFLWRDEMIFETRLDIIWGLTVKTETHFRVERNVLMMQHGGEVAYIYVSDIMRFKEAIEKVSAIKANPDSLPLYSLPT
jgi:hypothetical protein